MQKFQTISISCFGQNQVQTSATFFTLLLLFHIKKLVKLTPQFSHKIHKEIRKFFRNKEPSHKSSSLDLSALKEIHRDKNGVRDVEIYLKITERLF